MENTNPENKRLDVIVKEAEVQGIKVVLVAAEPILTGHHRIAALLESDKFMVVFANNLPKEDDLHVAQIMLEAKAKIEDNPFKNEKIFKFNAPKIEDLIRPLVAYEEEKISEPKVNIPAIAKKHDNFARMKGNRTAASKPLVKNILGFRGRR